MTSSPSQQTTVYLHPYSSLNIHSTKQHEASRISQEIDGLQYPDEFSSSDTIFFSSSHCVFSFHSSCIYSQPHRTARGAGGDPAQPVSTGSRKMVTQQRYWVSLQSAAALLAHNLPGGKSLIFYTECVHSSCSSLFWWKGGHVLLWTWKHGAALQKIITLWPEAPCDLRII